MSSDPGDVIKKIDAYYSGRLREHGATPRGVDWNSLEAQEIRFAQLYKLFVDAAAPTIIDYGCGYGALCPFVLQRKPEARVVGYDIATSMTEAAQAHVADSRCLFTSEIGALLPADYVVASGVFSVKMDVTDELWELHVESKIAEIAGLAKSGFAFNMLTRYSDADKMRPNLYYADPHRFFDHCRERYSRNLALLHDYELYEFTIHVRL